MDAADHLTASDRDRGESCGPRAQPRSFLRRAIDATRASLPQDCALCSARAGNALVCAGCEALLPRTRDACPVCALPSLERRVCGACLAHPPPFAATVAAFVYAFPVDRLLQALKYGGRLALADWAAGALASAVAASDTLPVDAIVALPLAPARQRERGFNQAHEIARRVGTRLAVPLARPLVRAGSGPPQAMLPWSARAKNVRGAFICSEDVAGLRLALVDDVMTTGATLAEAARALTDAGASRVDAWVVARTLAA